MSTWSTSTVYISYIKYQSLQDFNAKLYIKHFTIVLHACSTKTAPVFLCTCRDIATQQAKLLVTRMRAFVIQSSCEQLELGTWTAEQQPSLTSTRQESGRYVVPSLNRIQLRVGFDSFVSVA